jgi:ABC-type amino acid transport system permease subunit
MHSKTYNIASLLIFISGICVIVSFLSPYWIQVNISKGYSEFTNIGYNLQIFFFFLTFTVGIRNKCPKNQNKN